MSSFLSVDSLFFLFLIVIILLSSICVFLFPYNVFLVFLPYSLSSFHSNFQLFIHSFLLKTFKILLGNKNSSSLSYNMTPSSSPSSHFFSFFRHPFISNLIFFVLVFLLLLHPLFIRSRFSSSVHSFPPRPFSYFFSDIFLHIISPSIKLFPSDVPYLFNLFILFFISENHIFYRFFPPLIGGDLRGFVAKVPDEL